MPHHQKSHEGLLDFATAATPPTQRQVARALQLYTTILSDCAHDSIPLSPNVNTPLLNAFFLALYDHCPASGKSNVLFVVLHACFRPALPGDYISTSTEHQDPTAVLPRVEAWLNPGITSTQRQVVYRRLQTIAEDILHGFFVPLQAAGSRAPAVFPLIPARSGGDVGQPPSTPQRVSGLRAECLLRDDNRCVITGDLDYSTQEAYNATHPENPSDEDSIVTEVAHIIPHSFNAQNAHGQFGDARAYVWRIMDMLDPGISHQLAGTAIDSPRNAITMCPELHHRFGQLKWYLQPVQGPPHSYKMRLVRGQRLSRRFLPPGGLDATITFNNTAAAPPPDPRLIAFHRACCLILRMSGAGECTDRVLRDMEDMQGRGVLAEDGSSDFGMFWKLREFMVGVVVN